MSISSRITEMEQHIGNAYDKIEDLGIDLTNVDKNINNIATMLENVWDEYPKVTATNVEEARLNETKKGRMEIDLKGQTEQEQLIGKNLLPVVPAQTTTQNGITLTSNGDGSFNVSGTSTGEGDIVFDLPTAIQLPNDTIYVHLRNNVVANISCIFIGENISSSPSFSEVDRIMTSPNLTNMNLLQIGIHFTSGMTLNLKFTPSLELTNAVTDYEPYCGGIPSPNPDFPQQIKNVTGNANVKIQNKNLLPSNLTWQYGYVNGSGVFVGDATHKNAYSDYIYLKAGTYTISYEIATTIIAIAIYDTNKVFIERQQTIYAPSTSKNKTFTLNQDGYIRISHYDDTGAQIISNIKNEKNQLEQGSTATSYVPHQEQNLPFTFESGQRAMQGTELKDDGIHQKRKQIVLDGTETWNTLASQNTDNTFYITTAKYDGNFAKSTGVALCNIAIDGSVWSSDTPNMFHIYINQYDKLRFRMSKSFITSVAEWKAYLAEQYANGTPVIIEFELKENEEEIISYNETQQSQYNAIKQAKSYDDQTNISSTSDELGFIMDVESLRKIDN